MARLSLNVELHPNEGRQVVVHDFWAATDRAAAARAWHPWMPRVLDLGQAVRLRGWPDDLDITIPLDVTTDTDDTTERFTLRITAGKGELAPSACEGHLKLTRRQFAALVKAP